MENAIKRMASGLAIGFLFSGYLIATIGQDPQAGICAVLVGIGFAILSK
jgi:hypothetical protein